MSGRKSEKTEPEKRGFEDVQSQTVRNYSGVNNERLEIDIFLSRIWAGKWAILFTTVFCALLAGLFWIGWQSASRDKNYSYVIQFTFNGRENDEYPNGSPFKLTDLLAPAVLSEVHASNNLDELDLNIVQFQDRLSIAPFVADRETILEKYQTEYDKWITTAVELRELPDRALGELQRASQYSAIIEFTDFEGKIPESRAVKILRDIVNSWARRAIDELGVARVDLGVVLPSVFNKERLKQLEPLNQLRSLSQRAAELGDFIKEIEALPNGLTARDPSSGLNVSSLRSRYSDAMISMTELPANWSAKNLEQADTALLPVRLYSTSLFNPELISDREYLIAIDMVQERIDLLRQDVAAIENQSSGATVTDPVSGLTAYDIVRKLDDLEMLMIDTLQAPIVELGISRDPNLVKLHYESRLAKMTRAREQLAAAARVIDKERARYSGRSGASSDEVGTNADQSLQPNSPLGSGTTVIPQLGDGFIERLINLTEKGGDSKFRQQLTLEAIELQKRITEVDAEIDRMKQYLSRVSSEPAGVDFVRDKLENEYASEVDSKLPQAVSLLQQYVEITKRLALRLRYAQEIFEILFGQDKITSVKLEYYLRDAERPAPSLDRLVDELQEIARISNSLYDAVSAKRSGVANALFRPISDVEVSMHSIVSKRGFLLILVSAFFGFIFSLVFVLIRPSISRSPG